eukprot:30969-Pelagococcus_subviridis.AAC.4
MFAWNAPERKYAGRTVTSQCDAVRTSVLDAAVASQRWSRKSTYMCDHHPSASGSRVATGTSRHDRGKKPPRVSVRTPAGSFTAARGSSIPSATR